MAPEMFPHMQPAQRWRVLIPRPMTPEAERVAEMRFNLRLASRPLSVAETLEGARAHDAQGMIIGTNLTLSAETIAALPAGLCVIATTGAGLDHIDLDAARARNIAIHNVPEIGAEDTADLTLMLLLMACRRATEHAATLRAGWPRRMGYAETLGLRVTGRRLGIVGMGRIGQLVADRAKGFGMQVMYHQRRPAAGRSEPFFSDLDAMLPRVDTLSLHLPETEMTRGLLSAARIALMPHGSVLVNAARGGLVDEGALIEALASGQLAAAGLDVFCSEPGGNPALLALPNVAATPHVGSATEEARTGIALRCLDLVEEEMAQRLS
ncbi:2-hydroxyacid dehydrogenase [Salipiger marinus]|uniref:2-hydroxyacid dehydrogenase n=1 Tax=Salipiger marinus TaxID=555512 RepID=UPI004058233F